jgi:hypothetical protein
MHAFDMCARMTGRVQGSSSEQSGSEVSSSQAPELSNPNEATQDVKEPAGVLSNSNAATQDL